MTSRSRRGVSGLASLWHTAAESLAGASEMHQWPQGPQRRRWMAQGPDALAPNAKRAATCVMCRDELCKCLFLARAPPTKLESSLIKGSPSNCVRTSLKTSLAAAGAGPFSHSRPLPFDAVEAHLRRVQTVFWASAKRICFPVKEPSFRPSCWFSTTSNTVP